MNKLNHFREIEKKYPVERITMAGFKLWPYLRIYYCDQIVFNRDRRVKISRSTIRTFLISWFYGFFNLFKKYDSIVFSTTEQRKEIESRFYDRCDFLPEEAGKTLFIELPTPRHLPQEKLASQFVISKLIFYAIERLYASFTSRKWKLEGLEVVKKIESETGVNLAYRTLALRLIAQYKTMRFFTNIWKPKLAFFAAPYNFMGHVKALRQQNVSVIEMQHGTINKNHYAYHISKNIDPECYPQYLFTLGANEKQVFEKPNEYIRQENVKPVGSFYLDYLATEFRGDENFKKLSAGFKKVMAITAQDALEEMWAPFLKTVAKANKNYLYVLAPRHKTQGDYRHYNFSENVVFAPWLSTYEIIALSDFHSTINSTTALEAPSLGTQNLLINIENRARSYYQATLKDERITRFADSATHYLEILDNFIQLSRQEIRAANRDVIIPDFKQNLKQAVKDVLKNVTPP